MKNKPTKNAAKKLSLKKKTVRVLTATDLSQVGGGYELKRNCSCGD